MISYEEYKKTYKKMTKVERAYYEHNFGYGTRLNDEEIFELIEKTKKELQEKKDQILHNIEVQKILEKRK